MYIKRQQLKCRHMLPMKGKHDITLTLLYHKDYFVKRDRFKTKQASAVMVKPMNMINGVNDRQKRKIEDE